jgi:hypothetical protein
MKEHFCLTLIIILTACGPRVAHSLSQEEGGNLLSPQLGLTAGTGTITVTQSEDEDNGLSNGSISLREAVGIARSKPVIGTIAFDQSLAGRVIRLTKGQIIIDSNLRIVGPTGGVTIDADGKSRVFRICNTFLDTQVVLENLTLMNGLAPDEGIGVGSTGYKYPNIRGGAIYNTENLIVRNSTFVSNRALRGGAIVSDGGSLTISGSQFQRNLVGEFGGGILFDTGSSLLVENSSFVDNKAGTITIRSTSLPDYVVPPSRQLGGAITVDPETYTLRNVEFKGNLAANGGAIYHFQSTGVMEDCLFASSNSASMEGSAVWSFGGTLSLLRTQFENGMEQVVYNSGNKTIIQLL